MLFLTLALSLAAPVSAMPPEPQRARQTAAKKKRATRAPKTRMVRLTPVCGTGRLCRQDPNQRYRLTGATTTIPDAKGREVERGQAMACGTTGAPVCPSSGATFFRTGGD